MSRSEVSQPLFARSFGSGARQVMALHCTMAHSGAWRGLSEVMGEEITLHAPDMLNHAKSPDWDGEGEFQLRMAEAVLAQMSAPMDVVGHSFGGTIALRMAVLRPDLVRSLTMIEAVLFSAVAQDAPEVLARERAGSAPFREAMQAGELENAARIFNRGWGDQRGPMWADLSDRRKQAMIRGVQIVPACGVSIIEDRPGLMQPGGLEAVDMPVLLMRGGQSDEIIKHVNDGLARRLPQARNLVVEEAGHMLPVTHPVETADMLRAFWQEAG